MNRENKSLVEIEDKEREIYLLKQNLMNLRYLDFKDMEGRYYFIECFPHNGKKTILVYYIISVEENKIIYEYGDIENQFIAKHEVNCLFKRGYKSWKEITKKEYEKYIKGFQDIRDVNTGDKNSA